MRVTGDVLWEHRREVPEDIDEYVFNDLWQNNRNLAIHGSFIIDTSVDDHVFALDAVTGRLAWEPGSSTTWDLIVSGPGCSCGVDQRPLALQQSRVLPVTQQKRGGHAWRRSIPVIFPRDVL